jgi:hypothetical protein
LVLSVPPEDRRAAVLGYKIVARLDRDTSVKSAEKWIVQSSIDSCVQAGIDGGDTEVNYASCAGGGKISQLALRADSVNIDSAQYRGHAFVGSDGLMPDLVGKVSGCNSCTDITWYMSVRYTRSGRSDFDEYRWTGGPQWHVNDSLAVTIRGGEALLTATRADTTCSLSFHIRGETPDAQDVKAAMPRERPYLWIANHETNNYEQFNRSGTFQSGANDVRYTPNASPDGGFGIMQLTNPRPTAQQLWSWRDNVRGGIDLIDNVKMPSAQAYLGTNPGATQEMVDHETLAYFNGIGPVVNGARHGHYYIWDPTSQRWEVNPHVQDCGTGGCGPEELPPSAVSGLTGCTQCGACYAQRVIDDET